MDTIIIDGIKTYYKEHGKGENIVLVHGWGQSHSFWNDLQNRLSTDFHIYNLDLPGFGLTQEPPSKWSIQEYTSFIRNFILELNITDPIIIGHSFGGHIAIMYASLFPVKKLVLYSSGGLPQKSLKYDFYKNFIVNILKHMIPNVIYKSQTLMFKPKQYQNSVTINSKRSRLMLDIYTLPRPDLTDKLKAIKVKALIIVGENDYIVFPAMGQRMHEMIKESQLIVIPNAKHYSHIENPTNFDKELDFFLKNNSNK